MKDISSRLSRTEWILMNICWKKGKASARDIYEESLKEKERSYHTVKTLLERMVKKNYLEREKFGPIWLYTPIVSRSGTVSREIESFADTVLDNTFTPLLSFFTDKQELTDEEIAAMEKLIKENKRGK